MIPAILLAALYLLFVGFNVGYWYGRRSIATLLKMAHAADQRDAAMRCEDCSIPVKPSDFPTLCDACLMDRVSVSSSGLMAEAV